MKPFVLDQDIINKINSEPYKPTRTAPSGNPFTTNIGKGSKYDEGIVLSDPNTASHFVNQNRFDKQSNSEMWGNMIMQTAGTVTGDAVSGIGALLDMPKAVIGEVFGFEQDMQNAITRFGDSISETSREQFPIYTDANKPFDFGSGAWWAKNVPNIASTLSILIPAYGGVKALSYAGKAMQTTKLGALAKVGKALQLENEIAKTSVLALNQRVIENYREGSQVYNDMLGEASETLRDPEKFKAFMQTPEGKDAYKKAKSNDYIQGDLIDKMAHHIASDASWVSFAVNSSNFVFDFLQTAAFTKALSKSSRLGMNSNKVVGSNALLFGEKGALDGVAEATAKTAKAGLKGTNKAINTAALKELGRAKYIKNAIRPYSEFVLGASSEGVEEIVNAIGQGEGMNYGKLLLGQEKEDGFNDRLKDYLTDPTVWEQGFWGAIGGAVFQAGGAVKTKIDKARDKVGNSDVSKQMDEIQGRKVKLAELAGTIKNLSRNLNQNREPITGTEEEVAKEKQAIFEKVIAEIGSSMGINSATHGTADRLEQMWNNPGLEEFIGNLIEEDSNINPKTVVDKLKKASTRAITYYDKATNFFTKRTDKDYLTKLITNRYVFNKTQADEYNERAEEYKKQFDELLAKDAGYQELMKTDPNDPDAKPIKAVDTVIKNIAIEKAINKVVEQIKLNALQHQIEGTEDEITAFAQPVIDALKKQIVNVSNEEMLTKEEVDTINPDVIDTLIEHVIQDTLGKSFNSLSESIFTNKDTLPKAEKLINKHVAASKDSQRSKFNTHLATIASVTDRSSTDEINSMINQIKAEQVNLSKGEVTSWEGNKDVLTADVIKDLNTAANAMIKKLINLKEARREQNSKESARVTQNTKAVSQLNTDANATDLEYDDSITLANTYGDKTYDSEVAEWVDTDRIPYLEQFRGKPEFQAELQRTLTDAKENAANGVYRHMMNRILEHFYNYQTQEKHQQITKTNKAVDNALKEVQKSMVDPNGTQPARFAPLVKDKDTLHFDPDLATERQIVAATKLFNSIANALNKQIIQGKKTKLTFDEVLDYMFKTYGTDYISNPDVFDMIQKSYLIISVDRNRNLSTTARNTVINKFTFEAVLEKYANKYTTELEDTYIESAIIQSTGGEFATNIFLGDIQTSLVHDENGDLVSPNANTSEILDTLLNRLQVGDTVTISVNTKHESYDENKNKIKSVPIKINIKKTDSGNVEIGYINKTDTIESGDIVYELNGTDFMDSIMKDDKILSDVFALTPLLRDWLVFNVTKDVTAEENQEELEKLTQAIIDADTNNVLETLMTLHGEDNKIKIGSPNPSLLHLTRVLLFDNDTISSEINDPSMEEMRTSVENWKAKLLRDKVNHNRIRNRIEANVEKIIETTIKYKSKGNVVRSINPVTGEPIFRKLTDTIASNDKIELFVVQNNSNGTTLVNADPTKHNGFSKNNGSFKYTLYTQVESALRDEQGNPVMIPVGIHTNKLNGSRTNSANGRTNQVVDYVHKKLMEYVSVRRKINNTSDETLKNKLYEESNKLESEINELTPVINRGATGTDNLQLAHGKFTFTVEGKAVTYYFNREADALFINNEQVDLTDDSIKELIGKLRTNVVYSNFNTDIYTDPVTGETSSYKDYLLKNNIIVTDVGMLVDEKGNKISNVTISNDSNKGGRPLIINIDTESLSSKEIKTKAEFNGFVKRNNLIPRYKGFYSIISEMIKNGELNLVEQGNVPNDGFAEFNPNTNTLTLSTRWHELNSTAKSLILIHEFIHKALKADGIKTKYMQDINDFRLSIIDSAAFKAINFDADMATAKMLTAKQETTPLSIEEKDALRQANTNIKIYIIFTNSYINEDGKSQSGLGALDNEEIITYGLTDPEVAKFLNSIASNVTLKEGSNTKWQELKSIIKEFITDILNTITGATKLDELTAIVDKIFEDVDSFIENPDASPIEKENLTKEDISDLNKPNDTSDFDPDNIELAVFASNTMDTPITLGNRFKTLHPDGTMKRYFMDKQTEVYTRAGKINAALRKDNIPYKVRAVVISGESGDFREYLGFRFYPTDTQVTSQYAKFISELDTTKPIGKLRQEYNDYVNANPIETKDSIVPIVDLRTHKEGNSTMGFINVHNFNDEKGNKLTLNTTPFAYLGLEEKDSFTLQLVHKEFTDSTKDNYEEGSVPNQYFTNWGNYTFPIIFNDLIKQGFKKIVFPKFAFDEDTNDSIHEFAMAMEKNGMKVTYDETNITFNTNDIQQAQQAIYSAEEFLDNYSNNFTASEEAAVTNLVSYLYRTLKNQVYKGKNPNSINVIKNDIIKTILHHQKINLDKFTNDQINLQNRIVADLRNENSDAWKMAVRELRAKYKHNPEELTSLLEDNDVNNKWEDNSHLFDNPNETIGDQLKDVLASIPLVDPATVSYDSKTNKLVYNKVNNSLTGFLESADYKILNAKLLELLIGMQDTTEMLAKLKEFGTEVHSSYAKAIRILHDKLINNPTLTNAFFSYYSKRMTNRYANLFRNSGEALQHEQIISNKVDGKYTLADEWRNTILSNFDMEVFDEAWDQNWIKKYVAFGKAYNSLNSVVLPIPLAEQLSELYSEIGIEIDPIILQYYYAKEHKGNGNRKAGFGQLFLIPLNRLKSISKNPKYIGFIDMKMANPDIPFNEDGNLIRLGELVSYFTFGKGRFSTMNVKKNVVYTPSNPHYVSTFMDKLHHPDDNVVMNFLTEFTKVAGSEHSFLLWGDEYNIAGQAITGKTGKGFLNYQIVNGQRIPYSLNKKNINNVSYVELDGNQELSLGIPKEYADLHDTEWDITNLISFFNSERKTKNNSDLVTMPLVIPSDSGVMHYMVLPKTPVKTSPNSNIWEFFKMGLMDGNGDPNAVKFDNSAYYKADYYNQEGAELLKEAIESPIMQRYLAAFLAEIEEIKTATSVIFEIDEATGLPKRDANNMPIVKKDIEGQLFYHYMKHDPITNKPIYVDKNGMPTGRGFTSQLFHYTNRDGKIASLNTSKSIFKDGFISQYLDMTTEENKALLLFRIHNSMHEQYVKAQEQFKEYKDYVNKMVDKTQNRLLGSYTYEEAVGEMIFNHQLFNLEQQRFFMGSISNYKSNLDTTKRAKQITAPWVKNALNGTFEGATIFDVKLISSAINGKLEEAALAFKGLYGDTYDTQKILDAAKNKDLVSKLNTYEKAILDVISPYFDNDSANAVSFIILSEYKKRLGGFGLSDYYKDIITKLENGTPLSTNDYDRMIQLQKNFYYSYKYNPTLKKFVPNQVKNAEVILTPSLTNKLQLEALTKYMEETNLSQINVESAEKEGTIGIAKIHDENGDLVDDFAERLNAVRNVYHYDSLGKQQDVPDHILDAYNKLGVQISKKILDNIDFTQTYEVISQATKTLNGEQLIDSFFNHYSKNIKESSMQLMERIIKNNHEYEQIIKGDVKADIDYVKLKEVLIEQAELLGLPKNSIFALFDNINVEGNVPLYYNVFYKKWQAILTSLFSNNVINQKHPGPHATQMSTLFLKPPKGKISQFAQSYVGRKYNLRSEDRFANSNIDWAKHIHERKDYRLRAQRVEGTNIVKAEVLLPRTSSKFFKEKGNYTIDQLREIDPKLLTMIGYRIPTEDKHSMIVFEVVGFLPDETAAVVLPDDFVTQSGSDFDIDSLYMMMYNIENTYKNSLQIIDINEKNNNTLYDRYYKNVVNSTKGKEALQKAGMPIDKFISDITQTDVSYDELINKSSKEIKKILVDANLLMTDVEFESKKLKVRQELAENKKGRENAMLDIMVSILSHPAHIVERNTPNGHDDLSRAKQLVDTVTNTNNENLDPTTYAGQREFRSRNISTRNLKAFAVSRDGLLSIFQRTNAKINNSIGGMDIPPFTMTVVVDENEFTRSKSHISNLYPNATFETIDDIEYAYLPLEFLGRNSSGKFNNIDNKLITSYSAQFTANILDGVKDELPRSVNSVTLGWMETMVNLGATYNEVIAFYELPIIKKLIQNLEGKDNALKYKTHKNESIISAELFTEIYKVASKKGLRITRKSENGNYDIITLLESKPLLFPKTSEITELLKHYGRNSNLLPDIDTILTDINGSAGDFDAKLRDLQYLSVHKYISYVTTAIKKIATPLGVDKLGAGPTFEKTKSIIEKINEPNQLIISNGKPILNAIFDNFEDSVYKPLYAYYQYGNKLSYDTFSPLFITENPTYASIVDTLLNNLADGNTNPKRLEQAVSFLNKQLLHNNESFNVSDDEIKRLIGHGKFRGKTFKFNQANAITSFNKLSLTRKIELMRKEWKKENRDISNNILNFLTLESNSAQFERNKYERITYIDNDMEEVVIDSVSKLWISDNEFERSIARDIIAYAYHVNGLSYAYSSLARVIPTSVIAYEDNGGHELSANKGIGISKTLRNAFATLESIDENTTSQEIERTIVNLFGTSDLTRKFILSNYKDDAFVYNADNAVVFDNENKLRIFNPDSNGVITVPSGNLKKITRNNNSLDYIKLTNKEKEVTVYERYIGDIFSDNVYYYPVNKLEYYDRSDISLIDSNNVDISPRTYHDIIERYITSDAKTSTDISNGINISTNSTFALGKALNKVHYAHNMQSEFDIDPTQGLYGVQYETNPVNNKPWILPINRIIDPTEAPSSFKYRKDAISAQSIWGNSVEAWYRANSDINMSVGDKIELLTALNHIKLLTYPTLFNSIKQNGGIDFLKASKHQLGKVKRVDAWQGDGENSNYILTLMRAYQMINGATIESKSIVDANPTVNEIKPTVAENTTIGFQGYKSGFENTGKGTKQGDGKDKAMRQVANGFIGEVIDKNSSSYTSALEIDNKINPFDPFDPIAYHDEDGTILSGAEVPTIVMLARNGKFKNKPLNNITKQEIRKAKEQGAKFVVGDMPGVDSQFIAYLQEIDATFEIYHTGNVSRIKINPKKDSGKSGEQLDLFNQQAKFASNLSNQDLLDAMTESGDLEIICSGGATAANGMFIGSSMHGDWEVVSDLKGFPKHSAGGVDITVDNGNVNISNTDGTFKAEDGVFISTEPEIEQPIIPNLTNKKLLKSLGQWLNK